MLKQKHMKIKKSVIRRYFYVCFVLTFLLISILLSFNYTFSLKKEYSNKIEQLSTSLIDEKKRFLRNAVNRTIYFIENETARIRHRDDFSKLTEEQIDSISMERIKEHIRNLRLIDNGYIWVNRIVDYEGGDKYAIREIHPNLPHTEGIWLSTDMTDIKGNRPYEAELNGIKKDGELFSTIILKK